MTTYFEEPAITKRVIGSILAQIKREGIPTTLYEEQSKDNADQSVTTAH